MGATDPNHAAADSFANKTVFITGASSGLGLALARAFAAAQANVVMVSRGEEKLKAAAASLGAPAAPVLTVAADVADRAQVQRAVTQATARFGGLNIVVSCAGQGVMGPLADVPWDQVRQVFDANFLGAVHLVQAALPELRKQTGSHIVFISSILGLRAGPRSAVYSASKFALMGLAESLRLELRKDGIQVLAVCPGRIDTPFLDNATSVDGKKALSIKGALPPERVASRILDAIRARKRLLILPFSARLLYWTNLWCPSLVDRLLLRRFEKEGLL